MGRKPSSRSSFFKVLFDNEFTSKLGIPPDFVKRFGIRPRTFMLRNPTRISWHVEVESVANGLFFQNGWPGFVKDNSLELGDFLVFSYIAESKFNVRVYGKNCCEKEMNLAKVKSEESIPCEKKSRQKKAMRESKHHLYFQHKYYKGIWKKKIAVSGKSHCECVKLRKRKMVDVEREGAHKAVPFFEKEYLHFTLLWRHNQKYQMKIPRKFVTNLGEELADVVVLKATDGEVQHIKLRKADGKVWFRDGWREFVKYHAIHEGHLLIFIYEGNSQFHVLLYDTIASEKEHNLDSVCQVEENEQSEDEDSVLILDAPPQAIKTSDNPMPPRRSVRLSLQFSSANRTKSTNEIEARFSKERALNFTQLENQSSKPRRSARNRDQVEMRQFADGNESNLAEQDGDEPVAFTFENKVKAVPVHFNTPSNDISISLESLSNGTNESDQHPTKSVKDIGLQFDGSSLTWSTNEVECHCYKQRSRTEEFSTQQENQRTEPRKHEESANILHAGTFVSRRHVPTKDIDRAIRASRMFSSENPFFWAIMRSVSLNKSVYVPSKFAKTYLREGIHIITLQISDVRRWSVHSISREGKARLGMGWPAFARENNLEEGDVCLFEMININDIVLNVSIFHVMKEE